LHSQSGTPVAPQRKLSSFKPAASANRAIEDKRFAGVEIEQAAWLAHAGTAVDKCPGGVAHAEVTEAHARAASSCKHKQSA